MGLCDSRFVKAFTLTCIMIQRTRTLLVPNLRAYRWGKSTDTESDYVQRSLCQHTLGGKPFSFSPNLSLSLILFRSRLHINVDKQ